MAKHNQTSARRKLRSSYVTTTISISLVLLLLGLIGLLALNANKLSVYVKENIGFTVMIKHTAKDADVKQMEKAIAALPQVKSVRYITREQAAQELKAELGEDFVKYLGYNPLSASMEIRLYAQHANPDGMAGIEKRIAGFSEVKEIYYQKDLVHLIHENVQRIALVLAGFASVLMLIAIALINNTVRLMVYAKRFLIRTMQLVGATKSFIRKPFLNQGVVQGLISGFIANMLLSVIVYFSSQELSGVIGFQHIYWVGILYVLVFITGVLLTYFSTFFAVGKYLNLKTEELYF